MTRKWSVDAESHVVLCEFTGVVLRWGEGEHNVKGKTQTCTELRGSPGGLSASVTCPTFCHVAPHKYTLCPTFGLLGAMMPRRLTCSRLLLVLKESNKNKSDTFCSADLSHFHSLDSGITWVTVCESDVVLSEFLHVVGSLNNLMSFPFLVCVVYDQTESRALASVCFLQG